jgi:hypothetical protein
MGTALQDVYGLSLGDLMRLYQRNKGRAAACHYTSFSFMFVTNSAIRDNEDPQLKTIRKIVADNCTFSKYYFKMVAG